MQSFSDRYADNVALLDSTLRVEENFDILKKTLCVGDGEMTLYYIDGFIKDTVMQKLMMHFLSLKTMGQSAENAADEFIRRSIPYVEADAVDCSEGIEQIIHAVLSGAAVMLGSTFGKKAIVIGSDFYNSFWT